MKLYALLLLAAVAAVPASAKPVHIALKPAAAVSPDADGFFSLGSVADLTGGEPALRSRLAIVLVGRAPLSGETRTVTRGDLALKLRQAGCDPDKAMVLEGAETAAVTSEEPGLARPGSSEKAPPGLKTLPHDPSSAPEGLSPKNPALSRPGLALIHRGDAVTIVIQSDLLTIHALGIARENGAAGQTIRVHRDGVMTDLTVQVLDAHSVDLEI
jgi:hypothetical protein